MNIAVPESQVTRSSSRTLSVTDAPVQAKSVAAEPEPVHTLSSIAPPPPPVESDHVMTQNNRTAQISVLPHRDLTGQSSSQGEEGSVAAVSLSQPTNAVDNRSIPDSVDTAAQTIVPPSPTSQLDFYSVDTLPTTSSRSNLPKLTTLRTSSSSIPRTSSGSSLRQQASRLRQPSASVRSVSSHDTLKESPPRMVKADCSLTVAVIPPTSNLHEIEEPPKPAEMPISEEIYYSLDDIQPAASSHREQELIAELDRERAVIKVLQGQKLAIGKDLDYLSQMVDDLTDENERLKAQLESQKVM